MSRMPPRLFAGCHNCSTGICLFSGTCLVSMESESVRAESVNQRIGVSGIATAFRIISRFCLNRIWLEELNQLCPRITGMTLEESLESRGQKHWHLQQTLPINSAAVSQRDQPLLLNPFSVGTVIKEGMFLLLMVNWMLFFSFHVFLIYLSLGCGGMVIIGSAEARCLRKGFAAV